MYCRNCGSEISDNAVSCSTCKTKTGEGINYCANCGFHTNIKTEFCLQCGAKQRTVVSQKMKDDQMNDLKKRVKFHRTMLKISKVITLLSIISIVILVFILVARPVPDNIPDISTVKMSPNTFLHESPYMMRIGDTYYYDTSVISEELANYWIQSRALLSYIITSLFVFFISFIEVIVQRHTYKKILRRIKEVQ